MDLDKEELKATKKLKKIKEQTAHEQLIDRGYEPVKSKRGIVHWRGENYIGIDDSLKLIHVRDCFDVDMLQIIDKLCKEEGIKKEEK